MESRSENREGTQKQRNRERAKGQQACFAFVLKTQVKCRETASVGQPNYSSPATHSKPSERKLEKTKETEDGRAKEPEEKTRKKENH